MRTKYRKKGNSSYLFIYLLQIHSTKLQTDKKINFKLFATIKKRCGEGDNQKR